jgi:tetratricopeptide (TPR) repeat protein
VEGKDHHAVRRFVIRRLLHRFSAVRPLLVLLDEAHWSDDVLSFAQCMLSRATTDHPVMLIITACPWMAEGDAHQCLDSLMELEDVSRVHIGPLEPEHRSVLVRELLGLEPSLAAVVERRSGGNPQFAIQLVGDWVQKGMLVVGERGFKMRTGVAPDFPADLQAVWERRLAAALPSDKDIRSLQMAAAVGLDINVEWWTEACAQMGITPDWSLVEALEVAHLIIVEPGRNNWNFTHTLVAEALRRQADFSGTLPDLNLAVARMLEARNDPSLAPKLGRHLLRAGQLERGIDVLLDGADVCWKSCRFDRGWDLLQQREAALRRLRVPHSDLRWHRGWVAQAQLHRHRKDFEAAMSLYKRVLKRADDEPGESEMVGQALLGVGSIYRLRAEPAKARSYLKRTLALDGLSPSSRAVANGQLAALEVAYGNLSLATDYFEDALSQAVKSGDEDMIHKVKGDLAGVHRRRGEMKEARRYIEEAVRYYEKQGQRRMLSGTLNDLAEIERISGNIEIAEQGYRRALDILESLGDQAFYVARLNLGIIYSESGRTVEAREELEPCVVALQRTGLVGIEGVTHLVLAHVEAQEGNFEAWDRAFERGSQLVRETGFVDVDVARTAQKGGEVLLAAGERDRARTSFSLARDHWDLLEWSEAAAEIADLLEEMAL